MAETSGTATAPATGEQGTETPTPKEVAERTGKAPDVPADDNDDESESLPGGETLGDKGKQALDRMKAERKQAQIDARTARSEAQQAKDALAALQAKVEGKEAEHAAEQERRRIEGEALSKANEKIKRAEVKSIAAGKLADPADALLHLDLTQFDVDDDGQVDEDLIATAIDELLTRKPYLAAQGGRRFQGTADGGPRKETRKPQLTRDDAKRMSPEEIETAREAGQFDDLLGIKRKT